uniref:Uncharacterized protein n=1 Tax=Caenorhabditis japonica TaxID=281687 RepID=A0A8R1E204_CAEJA
MKKKSAKSLNRGISDLVRRATVAALYPYGNFSQTNARGLPSIQELLDESDGFPVRTETGIASDGDETEPDSDLEDAPPTIDVIVPTDGSVRNMEEFVANYNPQNTLGKLAPITPSVVAPRRSLHLGALIPDAKQLTAKLKRSKSMPKIQNMDQIKTAIRRKSSLRKWFATRTVAGRRISNTNNYDCKRTSITHEEFLAQMRNVTRNTLKDLLFPERKSQIQIVRLTEERFYDVDTLSMQLRVMGLHFPTKTMAPPTPTVPMNSPTLAKSPSINNA